MERLGPTTLLSSLLFVSYFLCRVLGDTTADTGNFIRISECLLNTNVTAWTITGSCNFQTDRQLTHRDCVWRRAYNNETVITSLPATIIMSEVSVEGQRYLNGSCSFSSPLSSHRQLGRSSFVVVIAFIEHRLESETVIEEPLAPVTDCPHNVTQGDSVTCYCRPNPAAPGRPLATVGWHGLPAGDPLVVSNINTSHADVVYQCQLRWGDPGQPLTMSLNHTFHLDNQEKFNTEDYIRSILQTTVACLLVAAALAEFLSPELLGSEGNVKEFLFRTARFTYLLFLLCYLPALLWMPLTFLLWLPYWLFCGVVWLVLSLCNVVWAAIVFFWQCCYYGFCLWGMGIGVWMIAERISPSTSKTDPLKDFNAQPPKYWKVFPKYLEMGTKMYQEPSVPHRVELATSDIESRAVAHLMYRTWKTSSIGLGKDAKNLSHTYIQVLGIERIENLRVWDKYNHKRYKMASSLSNAAIPVDKISHSTGPVLTAGGGEVLLRHLNSQVNEHYLFHGTKEETLFEITRDGLDNRYANNGLLGRGLYFAESSTKSDQYTDDKYSRSGGSHVMLLVRVLLGNAYVSNNPNPPNYVRPPCSRCQQTRCQCPECAHYDSVIDDAGRLFREFVVYDSSQCYPEYVIRYQRTYGPPPPVLPPPASNDNTCCVS